MSAHLWASSKWMTKTSGRKRDSQSGGGGVGSGLQMEHGRSWWGLERQPGAESPKVMGTCLQRQQGWTLHRGIQEGTMGQGICTLEDGILVWH